MKYHIRTNHKGEKKNQQYLCDHANCKLRFKTKKQKLNHHNKLEKECCSERNSLIKLVSRYKNLYFSIIKEFNLVEKVESLAEHIQLKSEFEERLKNSYDSTFFIAKIGEFLDMNAIPSKKLC